MNEYALVITTMYKHKFDIQLTRRFHIYQKSQQRVTKVLGMPVFFPVSDFQNGGDFSYNVKVHAAT